MKTIVIFSGYYLPHLGGVEKYTASLSSELIKKGYNVIVVTSNYNEGESYEEISNVKVIRLPIYNIFKNRYPIIKKNSEYKKLMQTLDEYDISSIIVNTRFYFTSFIGIKYANKKNLNVYLIEHGSNYVTLDNKFIDFFANRYEDILTCLIKNKVDGFYGVSHACGRWLKNFNIEYDGVWYNAVDCKQKLPQKKCHNKVNYLYAGRVIKQKGIGNILEAFTRLEETNSNIHLFIAGDGSELDNYRKKYNSSNIEFLGKLDFNVLLNYYAITDIFLYPPLWPEGLPTSILEAGLMECAVIGTDKGGIKEIIKDKRNGLITLSDVNSLYNAMLELLNDKIVREKYAKKLKKDVLTKFSFENTASKVLKDIGIE